MSRDEILKVIDTIRPRLAMLGVRELSLFGSYARNEATPDSDIDFLVEFSHASFDRYMDLKELLEELLVRRVDLVMKSAIKTRLRERILREAVRAPRSRAFARGFFAIFSYGEDGRLIGRRRGCVRAPRGVRMTTNRRLQDD